MWGAVLGIAPVVGILIGVVFIIVTKPFDNVDGIQIVNEKVLQSNEPFQYEEGFIGPLQERRTEKPRVDNQEAAALRLEIEAIKEQIIVLEVKVKQLLRAKGNH